jgi:GT2 family glycosyltransferase
MPDVSVILVNYKTARLTVAAVASLRGMNPASSLEIIVVDNDSGDDSEAVIRAGIPGVIWHQMGYNAGFGRANNVGMRLATGRYVLLLNADTLQTGDVLDECVRRMDAEPDIVAAAPVQLYPDGSPMPYYTSFADIHRTFYILPLRPFFQNLLEKAIPASQYADPRQHDWLVGAFLLVRRDAALKSGGFDEHLFMYGEDVEWGWRLGKLGKLCYFTDLGFIHLENPSAFRRDRPSYVNRFSVQMQVSNFYWLRKQYGVWAVVSILLNYALLVPLFFAWKMALNLLKGKPLTAEMRNQRVFARKTRMLFRYFWPIVSRRERFFKIKPEENVDALPAAGSSPVA